MRLALVALLGTVFLAAQQPRSGPPRGRPPGGGRAAQATQLKPEDACAVSGQVLDASTGEPLKRATVTLRRASPGEADGAPRGYTAATDSSGRFAMAGIAPGDYRLSARRNGFVDTAYGSAVTLRPGQQLADVLFRMTPHGVITGRVVDEDGEPVPGVRMQAMRYRYPQGRKQLSEFGEDNTNDIGEYRIAGLPAGRYYLRASPRRSSERGIEAAGGQPEEEYAATYFPGTGDVAAAAGIDVAAGGQLRGVDLTLRRSRTVSVRGRVSGWQPTGRQRLVLFLRPRGGGASPSMMRPGFADQAGNFEFRGVTPGSYTLVAAVPERGRGGLTGRLPVEVGNANVENLSLALNPPVTVAGRVLASAETAVSFAGVEVALRPFEPVMFGPPAPSARVKADGTFSFENVSPDAYTIAVSRLPDGYYVKTIAAGGQNVLLTGVDLSQGIAGGIDILLSEHAGQLTGVAQDDRQEAVAGAAVVLVPQEKERRGLPQYYRSVTADAGGRFTLRNLDPGEYRIYAWREIEPGAYFDPDFLRPVENRGEAVSVREDGREEVKVRVIG